ncbi:hypothetical protein BN871_EC_00180 [Paenibacillus sp. P22]|nr:hypothetical protein BN871_EC_00180 [Paenibacillus sp. P22]
MTYEQIHLFEIEIREFHKRSSRGLPPLLPNKGTEFNRSEHMGTPSRKRLNPIHSVFALRIKR